MKTPATNSPHHQNSNYKIIRTGDNLFQWLMLICICSSCASVYIPGSRNVPLLSKQGEFQASGSIGNGVNINTAYAIANHVGVMGNAMYANNKWRKYDNTYSSHRSVEGALGYFGSSYKFKYDLYLGYGGGKGYAQDSLFGWFFFNNTQKISTGTYHKAFVQPSFSFKVRRADFIITTRVTRVDFSRLSIKLDGDVQQISQRRFYFFEPSFTAKFNIREGPTLLYAFAQAGFNVTEYDRVDEEHVPYEFFHYGVGFGIKL